MTAGGDGAGDATATGGGGAGNGDASKPFGGGEGRYPESEGRWTYALAR